MNDIATKRSREILTVFREKKYNDAYTQYEHLFNEFPEQKQSSNLNNILVSIYKIKTDKIKTDKIKTNKINENKINENKELISKFLTYLEDYLNFAKESDNLKTWAENILLDLFEYALNINIIKNLNDLNNEPYFKSKIEKFIHSFIDVFSKEFDEKVFMQTMVAFIFKERANFFERKHNNKITKLLSEIFLKYTAKNSSIYNELRATIFNLLSDMQVTSLSGKSFDDNYKKAIEYLSLSLIEFNDNSYAVKRKEELKKVALTHKQIRMFRHDTTSTISSIKESITSLIDNKEATQKDFIKKLKLFRNQMNNITGHFNLIQLQKPDVSCSYNIETFLKHLIADYNFISEADIIIEHNELAKEIEFDANYFTAIIINFIKNSREAYRKNKTDLLPKPAIVISFDFKQFTLTFKDFAGGVENEMIDKIFEPYVSTKGTQNNTGMGLAIVKNAVDMHGWDIKVENTYENGHKNGLKFIINLNNKMEEF